MSHIFQHYFICSIMRFMYEWKQLHCLPDSILEAAPLAVYSLQFNWITYGVV
jgi:hypothetical protein